MPDQPLLHDSILNLLHLIDRTLLVCPTSAHKMQTIITTEWSYSDLLWINRKGTDTAQSSQKITSKNAVICFFLKWVNQKHLWLWSNIKRCRFLLNSTDKYPDDLRNAAWNYFSWPWQQKSVCSDHNLSYNN